MTARRPCKGAHAITTSPSFDTRVWRVLGDPLVRGAATGLLARRTVAVKDLFAVAGQKIGAGNPAYLAEAQPRGENAPAVAALLAAGADILGIAQTDEFAYSLAGTNAHYGAPPNPAVPGGVSGGSSSGPASAVALGEADIGLGTDTAGSIRVPASYQGLVGLRTTHGAVDATRVLPLAPSFDTVGWLARNVAAVAAVADVLLAGQPDRPLAATRTLTLPIARDWLPSDVAATHETLCSKLCVDSVLPPLEGLALDAATLDRWMVAFRTLQFVEAHAAHGAWIAAHPGALGADVGGRFAAASKVTEAEGRAARETVAEARAWLRAALEGAVLAIPSAAGGAPLLDADAAEIERQRVGTVKLTCLASLAGLPSVSVPALQTGDGRPLGFALIGSLDTDRDVLRLAARVIGLRLQTGRSFSRRP